MNTWLLAGLGLALAFAQVKNPGKWDDLLKEHNPWRGFEDDDSVLTVTRVFRSEEGSCQPWLKRLAETAPGKPFTDWPAAWAAWGPWAKSDLDGVRGCDGFPCDVKLNQTEVATLAHTPEADRMAAFEKEVSERAQRFQASGPESYEFPGKPVDPWAYFDKNGYQSEQARPTKPQLRARSFNLDPDRMKTLHQILDVRSAAAPTEASVWVRSLYSDHYFDAWGEWRNLKCQGNGTGFTLVLALVVDFDLLKKTDIISRIARGRMRNVVRDNGTHYLDDIYGQISQGLAK